MTTLQAEDITSRVKSFYESMPFNYSHEADSFVEIIKNNNPIKLSYPNLHKILSDMKDEDVIDIGCGTGWFPNSVARHYNLKVTGIDMCETALKRAEEISQTLNITDQTEFIQKDIFTLKPDRQYALVNSIGVLHHTHNCREALRIVSRLVRPQGYLHIGLYHKYGREPFLDLFKEYRDKLKIGINLSPEEEKEAFIIYRALNKNIRDEKLLQSWFRDQVLHPHETQHTLKEVYNWLNPSEFEIISTSVNKFQPVENIEDIFREEQKLYDISQQKNHKQKTYYPGFFTFLAQRKA